MKFGQIKTLIQKLTPEYQFIISRLVRFRGSHPALPRRPDFAQPQANGEHDAAAHDNLENGG